MNRPLLTLALVLACAAPAAACTPVMSVGFKGLMLGWLLWLVLTPFAMGIPSTRLFWALVVPVGMMGFAVPMFGVLLIVPVLVTIAFPMHLALEFFDALYHPDGEYRGFRLFYNGAPLAVMLGLGLSAKAALYGEYGGLRTLAWNYTREGESLFFGLWLAVALVVLWQHRAQHREAWPF